MISRTPIDGYRAHLVYDRERSVTVYAPPTWSVWRVGVEWNTELWKKACNWSRM